MRFTISDDAAKFIISKGGQVIIFQGSLTGCCVGNIPSPMLEVGRPRRPLENYDILNPSFGITIYLDKDLASYDGIGEITLSKNLRWKSLSFHYHAE